MINYSNGSNSIFLFPSGQVFVYGSGIVKNCKTETQYEGYIDK